MRGGLPAPRLPALPATVPPRSVLPQYLLPKQALTRFAGLVANLQGGAFTTWLIRDFIRRYDVQMQEAVQPDPAAYATFNEFFTRALKPAARPLAPDAFVSPVDGAVSQCGRIARDRIFQAKGHHYTAGTLVGGNLALAERFTDGEFATLYLSPKDYHRIHMPCDGTLTHMVHVPGDLFSVNPTTARGVPGLFARNERVVCVFDGPRGPWVLVLVGATIVGSMETVWHGVVNARRTGRPSTWDYAQGAVHLRKGEEMGRFRLGSTVVMLFPKGTMAFADGWVAEAPVRMGQPMGRAPG